MYRDQHRRTSQVYDPTLWLAAIMWTIDFCVLIAVIYLNQH